MTMSILQNFLNDNELSDFIYDISSCDIIHNKSIQDQLSSIYKYYRNDDYTFSELKWFVKQKQKDKNITLCEFYYLYYILYPFVENNKTDLILQNVSYSDSFSDIILKCIIDILDLNDKIVDNDLVILEPQHLNEILTSDELMKLFIKLNTINTLCYSSSLSESFIELAKLIGEESVLYVNNFIDQIINEKITIEKEFLMDLLHCSLYDPLYVIFALEICNNFHDIELSQSIIDRIDLGSIYRHQLIEEENTFSESTLKMLFDKMLMKKSNIIDDFVQLISRTYYYSLMSYVSKKYNVEMKPNANEKYVLMSILSTLININETEISSLYDLFIYNVLEKIGLTYKMNPLDHDIFTEIYMKFPNIMLKYESTMFSSDMRLIIERINNEKQTKSARS